MRLQTRLDEASDALDDAGDGNLEALRREGARLVADRDADLDRIARNLRAAEPRLRGPARAARPPRVGGDPRGAALAECSLSRSRRICAPRGARPASRHTGRAAAPASAGPRGRVRITFIAIPGSPGDSKPNATRPSVVLGLQFLVAPGRAARRGSGPVSPRQVRTAEAERSAARRACAAASSHSEAAMPELSERRTSSSCGPPVRTDRGRRRPHLREPRRRHEAGHPRGDRRSSPTGSRRARTSQPARPELGADRQHDLRAQRDLRVARRVDEHWRQATESWQDLPAFMDWSVRCGAATPHTEASSRAW